MPTTIDDAVRAELWRHFSERDAEWIVLSIAMMGWLNKTMDALGVPLEEPTVAEVTNVIAPSGWMPSKHLKGTVLAGYPPAAGSLATPIWPDPLCAKRACPRPAVDRRGAGPLAGCRRVSAAGDVQAAAIRYWSRADLTVQDARQPLLPAWNTGLYEKRDGRLANRLVPGDLRSIVGAKACAQANCPTHRWHVCAHLSRCAPAGRDSDRAGRDVARLSVLGEVLPLGVARQRGAGRLWLHRFDRSPMRLARFPLFSLPLLLGAPDARATRPEPPNAAPNDNRMPAGILRDTMVVQWRPVAKDGADLPPAARAPRPARQTISMGETYDFSFTPPRRGDYRLEIRGAGPTSRLFARVPLRVQ